MRNKTTNIYKGVLEAAGLGEIAFYLKKAKTQLSYAEYALEHTNFEEITSKSKKLAKKLDDLRQTIIEIDDGIDSIGQEMAKALENSEQVEE